MNAPTEQDFYQLKLAENCALAVACRTGDAAEFRRFAALRNERAAHFPQIAVEEWKAETIEGMAETVCLRALRVLDPARYAEALACYLAKLENELPLLFDARRLCYYTGTVLCLTLERLGLPFYNDFTGTTLYEQNRPTDALCFEAPEVPRWRPFLPSTSKNSRPPWQPTGRLAHSTPAKPRSAATIP